MPDALRLLLIIPGAFLLAGSGADFLWRGVREKLPRRVAIALLTISIAGLSYEAYHEYFKVWGAYPGLTFHFDSKLNDYARQINALPRELPKYVVVTGAGELAHGIAVSAEPIMFLTNTYTDRGQKARNVHYLSQNASGTAGYTTDAEHCRQVVSSIREGMVYCLLGDQ